VIGACNTLENPKKQKDTIAVTRVIPDTPYHTLRLIDWNGVKEFEELGDTTISHSVFIKMCQQKFDSTYHVAQIVCCDTIWLQNFEGDKIGDTVIYSMVMPKK